MRLCSLVQFNVTRLVGVSHHLQLESQSLSVTRPQVSMPAGLGSFCIHRVPSPFSWSVPPHRGFRPGIQVGVHVALDGSVVGYDTLTVSPPVLLFFAGCWVSASLILAGVFTSAVFGRWPEPCRPYLDLGTIQQQHLQSRVLPGSGY